jgi:glycine cleavage system H protein
MVEVDQGIMIQSEILLCELRRGLAMAAGARIACSRTMRTVFYKRATFVAHLPEEYLFTHSHSWLAPQPGGATRWRVGLTKFALRMLGEVVDVQFERQPGEPVLPGDVVGTIEGFKALSDLFCVGSGTFLGGNPALATSLAAIENSPHEQGWLYEIEGSPDARALTAAGYCNLLDATIDRMLQKERESKESTHER